MGRQGYEGPDMRSPAGRAGLRGRLQRAALTTEQYATINEQADQDAEWERYCREKADPFDEAWGDR